MADLHFWFPDEFAEIHNWSFEYTFPISTIFLEFLPQKAPKGQTKSAKEGFGFGAFFANAYVVCFYLEKKNYKM